MVADRGSSSWGRHGGMPPVRWRVRWRRFVARELGSLKGSLDDQVAIGCARRIRAANGPISSDPDRARQAWMGTTARPWCCTTRFSWGVGTAVLTST